MEILYRTRNGRFTFKVEAPTEKAGWERIAQLEDVFEADDTCGCCGCTNIRHRVRTHQDNKYYELRCLECNAQLSFGQHKTGDTLFPKRSNESGPLPNRGWYKWQPKDDGPF